MEGETDETPFGALCDATLGRHHKLATAPCTIGTAVQGAVRGDGGVAWYKGRVVSNDSCSMTVRFDKDSEEESCALPSDRRGEVRFLRPDAPGPSRRPVARGGKAQAPNHVLGLMPHIFGTWCFQR